MLIRLPFGWDGPSRRRLSRLATTAHKVPPVPVDVAGPARRLNRPRCSERHEEDRVALVRHRPSTSRWLEAAVSTTRTSGAPRQDQRPPSRTRWRGTGAAPPQCRTVIATTGAGTSTPMASTTCATPFDDAGAAHLLALARLGTWTLTAALLGRARRAPGLRRNLRRLLHGRASEVPERGLAGFQEPRRPEPPRQR